MIVLITASLKGTDEAAFHEVIKAHSPIWWHYIDATWLVKTDHSPSQWISWLRPVIDDKKDSVFITKIDGSNFSGWLPQKAYDWIRNNN